MAKHVVQWLKQHPLLAVILAIGALARIVYAGSLPPGLNQDEASIGYDAYSILHYGMDRNGIRLPVHLIAWGSGQNALYAYFSMPFILLFGLNEWSVRAVGILFGIIGMIAVYGIARRMFDGSAGALLAVFLAAIAPWHLMMSRWALESNLFPTLVLLAVWMLLKGLERPGWLFGFTATLALSVYAYGTSYFFVPVFALSAAVLLLVAKRLKPATLLLHAGLLTLLALPICLFVLINRFGRDTIATPLFSIPKLTVPRVEQISSVFSGDAFGMIRSRLADLIRLLAAGNDGLLWNAIPPFGYLYPIALPFIAAGFICSLYLAFRMKRPEHGIVLLWLAAAVLTALIVDININRINIIFYPLILLAAGGLWWAHRRIRHSLKLIIPAFAVYFGIFCWHYATVFPDRISPMFYESFGEAIVYAGEVTEGEVYVTGRVNMPYIYVLFYERIDPRLFQETVVYGNPGAPFRQVRSFGRYRFGELALRPGRDAAYIFAKGDPLPDAAALAGYETRTFKHFTVVSGGALGLLVNGVPAEAAEIPPREDYSELVLPAVELSGGEEVTIYLAGGEGWINADEVRWIGPSP